MIFDIVPCPRGHEHPTSRTQAPKPNSTVVASVATWDGERSSFPPLIPQTLVPYALCLTSWLALMAEPGITAEFSAANEGELLQAIQDANASSDPSSTIILLDSISLSGSNLPSIEKSLIIDIGTHTLTLNDDTRFDVGDGATLVLDGSFQVTGVTGETGILVKSGEGTLRITGGPSDVFWRIRTEQGVIIFDEGAVLEFGDYFGDVPNTQSISDAPAGIRVTGPGTIVTNRYTTVLQAEDGSRIDVENGATFNSKGIRLAAKPDTSGTANVNNATVTVDDLHVHTGDGHVSVTNGAEIQSRTVRTGVVIDFAGNGIEDKGGTGHFVVSGKDSRWLNEGFFMLTRGTLSVLDGGRLETAALRAGHFDNELTDDAVARILVSGPGSSLHVTSGDPDAFIIGGGVGAVEKSAELTVSDRANVMANGGLGTIRMATLPASTGTISIGGSKGEAPRTAGELHARRIEFGPGQGEIHFNHTDSNYDFNIPLVGNGQISHTGPGRTTFTANQQQFTGNTTLQSGTVTVNGILGGTFNLLGGRLAGTGTVGTLIHDESGIIAPGNSIGQLTIDGDYTGNGGVIEIETVLGGDSSPTDRLKITGNSSGTATIHVTNMGGTGAPTVEGIKIVEVDGESEAQFTLNGDYLFENDPAIVAGAYAYRLFQNGVTTPTDGDWYLRSSTTSKPGNGDDDDDGGDNGGGNGGGGGGNGGGGGGGNGGGNGGGGGHGNGPHAPTPVYQAGVPLYQSYPGVLQSLNRTLMLKQRTGNRHQSYDATVYPILAGSEENPSSAVEQPIIWNRINAAHAHVGNSDATISDAFYALNSWRFDAGVDALLVEDRGRLIGGLSGHHIRSSAEVSSRFGSGRVDTTGSGVGATLTWYGENGFYLDGSAQATWYKSDLTSYTATRTLVPNNRGFGYSLSAETGVRIDVGDGFALIPQAQLTYSSVSFNTFRDTFGARISPRRSEDLSARLGFETHFENFWQTDDGQEGASLYSVANLHYALLSNNEVSVSGVNIHSMTIARAPASASAEASAWEMANWSRMRRCCTSSRSPQARRETTSRAVRSA